MAEISAENRKLYGSWTTEALEMEIQQIRMFATFMVEGRLMRRTEFLDTKGTEGDWLAIVDEQSDVPELVALVTERYEADCANGEQDEEEDLNIGLLATSICIDLKKAAERGYLRQVMECVAEDMEDELYDELKEHGVHARVLTDSRSVVLFLEWPA